MAATPALLASVIAQRATDTETVSLKLKQLSERLTSEEPTITAAYAYDHCEEELIWIAEALEELAKQAGSLTAYTATGQKRQPVAV